MGEKKLRASRHGTKAGTIALAEIERLLKLDTVDDNIKAELSMALLAYSEARLRIANTRNRTEAIRVNPRSKNKPLVETGLSPYEVLQRARARSEKSSEGVTDGSQ